MLFPTSSILIAVPFTDVVPVDDTTAEQWEYDPFSGYDDGIVQGFLPLGINFKSIGD